MIMKAVYLFIQLSSSSLSIHSLLLQLLSSSLLHFFSSFSSFLFFIVEHRQQNQPIRSNETDGARDM